MTLTTLTDLASQVQIHSAIVFFEVYVLGKSLVWAAIVDQISPWYKLDCSVR